MNDVLPKEKSKNQRLIEIDFPIREVGKESVLEKKVYFGHISTLHTWWARRPLSASRSTLFAALVSVPEETEEIKKELEFVWNLSRWEKPLNTRLIETAREKIKTSFEGKAPTVLDCFAGGGAIPLEALRLGCKTYALELNPVAVIILKAVLEYPQKFASEDTKLNDGLRQTCKSFMETIEEWGKWVLEESRKEIGQFYPQNPDGSIPVGYIWVRNVRCQNSSCKAEIPLIKQLWIARKKNRKIALKMLVDKKTKRIDFKIIQGKEVDASDPSLGTTRRATVLCPVCNSAMSGETLRREAKNGHMGQRLIVVVGRKPATRGKVHHVATERDLEIIKNSKEYLTKKIQNWKWNFDPIPNEPTPLGGGSGAERAFSIRKYGLNTWGDAFNDRQKLALITFLEKVRLAYQKMLEKGYSVEYSKAIVSYLALTLSKLSSFNSSLSMWDSQAEKSMGAIIRNGWLPMTMDYFESAPFSGSTGSWEVLLKWTTNAINLCFDMPPAESVVQGTATRLPFGDNFFDAVATDPPYYDNVPYSDLSDFFYVWLKRAIGDLYPDLFSTPLTPKSQEIIMDIARHGNSEAEAKAFFENMITQSFKEIHRVLKPEGIAVIVFAYKSTQAWETIISSLLRSGLTLEASWPIHTERKRRMRAKESAALASSVYMVCRKHTKEKIAYFNEIKVEIDQRIKEKLTQFWEQGISGADFFVSAIGPSVEVFGKYLKVEKLSGEEVSVQELLEYVRKIVSEFALERVLKRADLGGVDAETRFYLLWRWTFGNAKVHFDDAIKLSRPMGVELTQLWDGGSLVKKEKEFIRVLAPQERAKDSAFLKKTKFTSIIDVLHYVLVLWERGEREKIKEVLNETGYAGNEIFWQTAQAISEVLPQGDKEKQLLQGFLYGKEVYVKEARGKTSLLDYMESR